jgi:hypothetical protein
MNAEHGSREGDESGDAPGRDAPPALGLTFTKTKTPRTLKRWAPANSPPPRLSRIRIAKVTMGHLFKIAQLVDIGS